MFVVTLPHGYSIEDVNGVTHRPKAFKVVDDRLCFYCFIEPGQYRLSCRVRPELSDIQGESRRLNESLVSSFGDKPGVSPKPADHNGNQYAPELDLDPTHVDPIISNAHLAGGLALLLLGLLILLLWQLPRIREFDSGAPTFLVYLVAALLAATVTFGILRSAGTFRGERFGAVIELGGAASLFFPVLLVGLYFEIYEDNSPFSLSIVFHRANDPDDVVRVDGKIILYLDEGPKSVPVVQGQAVIEDLANGLKNTSVRFDTDFDGFELVRREQIRLTPRSQLAVPIIEAKTKASTEADTRQQMLPPPPVKIPIETETWASSDILRTIYEGNPPETPAGRATPRLGLEILAQRANEHALQLLQDGDTLHSEVDNYLVLATPSSEGHLYILQFDSNGVITWLHPRNETSTFSTGDNPVRSGRPVRIPPVDEVLYLDHRTGIEHIVAVFSVMKWESLEQQLRTLPTEPSIELNTSDPPRMRTRGAAGKRQRPAPMLQEQFSINGSMVPMVGETLKESEYLGNGSILVISRWFRHK
jgi:hypothetical protein